MQTVSESAQTRAHTYRQRPPTTKVADGGNLDDAEAMYRYLKKSGMKRAEIARENSMKREG